MAATYEPIASQTLTGTATEVTFTSIPATFTDLLLVAHVRGATAGTSSAIQLNGDTNLIHSATQIFGNGSTEGSTRYSGSNSIFVGINESAADTFASVVIHLMSYSNTNVFKTVLAEGAAPSQAVVRRVGLFQSTSAVSTVRFFLAGSANIQIGSTFSLYGIKAA